MFSRSVQYAIRATVYVAIYGSKSKPARINDIADSLDIPRHYLSKILQQLTAQNIVSSIKGPGGGYYILDEKRYLPTIKIVEIIDGLGVFTQCGLGLRDCGDARPCPLHSTLKPYREAWFKALCKIRIIDLISDTESGDSFITNMPLQSR